MNGIGGSVAGGGGGGGNGNLPADALYSPNFESLIREFYKITNANFSVEQISPIVEAMKQSKILEYIMRDPTHVHAISCLRQFLQSRPYLPQEFIGRFLAVISVKINVLPSHMSITNQSFVAKVIANNVKPPVTLTNFSVTSMRDQLRQDIEKSTTHVLSSNTVPSELKIKISPNVMNMFVNSMSDLCKTIDEANRLNGREADSYIRRKIRYTNV